MKFIAVILLGLWVAGPAFATGELEPENPEVPEAATQDAAPMAPEVSNPEEAPTPEPVAPPPQGSVARAVFTTGVVDREPADAVEQLSADHERVFFLGKAADKREKDQIETVSGFGGRELWDNGLRTDEMFHVGDDINDYLAIGSQSG